MNFYATNGIQMVQNGTTQTLGSFIGFWICATEAEAVGLQTQDLVDKKMAIISIHVQLITQTCRTALAQIDKA